MGVQRLFLKLNKQQTTMGAKSYNGQTIYRERGAEGKESVSTKARSGSETEAPTGSPHSAPESRAGDADDRYDRESSQWDEGEGAEEETEGGHLKLKSVEQERPRSIIMKGLGFLILVSVVGSISSEFLEKQWWVPLSPATYKRERAMTQQKSRGSLQTWSLHGRGKRGKGRRKERKVGSSEWGDGSVCFRLLPPTTSANFWGNERRVYRDDKLR